MIRIPSGSWTFRHWPSNEHLTNLTDRNPRTCVKFKAVQLERNVLLKAPGPGHFSSVNWSILMLSKNLVLPSECESSIMVMTQFGVPDITDESLCRPFCGQLVRGNLSKRDPRLQSSTGMLPMNMDVVMASFQCNYRHPCKGIFIHITEKSLLDPKLDLEICGINFNYWPSHGRTDLYNKLIIRAYHMDSD